MQPSRMHIVIPDRGIDQVRMIITNMTLQIKFYGVVLKIASQFSKQLHR